MWQVLHATLLLSHVDNKLYKIILNGTRQCRRSVKGEGRGELGVGLPASNRAGVAACLPASLGWAGLVVGQSLPACAAATLSRGHKNYLQLNALNMLPGLTMLPLLLLCVRQLWKNACNVTLGSALQRGGRARQRGQGCIRFGVQFVSREFL